MVELLDGGSRPFGWDVYVSIVTKMEVMGLHLLVTESDPTS